MSDVKPSLFNRLQDYFDPELAARKARARAAAIERERRERQAQYEAEVGALAANPAVVAYRQALEDAGRRAYPGNGMDAAGAYWFRRGLEHAEKLLDDLIAAADVQD